MKKKIIKFLKNHKAEAGIMLFSLVALNLALTSHIVRLEREEGLLKINFLNIGQGDAALLTLPGGAQILIDGGPSPNTLLQELSRAMSPFDRSIDLISSSHPQQDHIGGLPEVFKRYKTNAYISNQDQASIGAYTALHKNLNQKNVPALHLFRGDKIKYKESIIHILHPAQCLETECPNKDLNENSIVFLVKSASTTALFTGDIGFATERQILQYLEVQLPDIDVLKVPHHGSKYSTSNELLQATKPKIAVVQVGENRWGHPTKETLNRLKSVNAKILRNDQDGTITITSDGTSLTITKK